MFTKVLAIALFSTYTLAIEDVPTSYAKTNDYHNTIKHIQTHINVISKPALVQYTSQSTPDNYNSASESQSPQIKNEYSAISKSSGLSSYSSGFSKPSVYYKTSPASSKTSIESNTVQYTSSAKQNQGDNLKSSPGLSAYASSSQLRYTSSPVSSQSEQYSSSLKPKTIYYSPPASYKGQYSAPSTSQSVQYSAPISHGFQNIAPLASQSVQYAAPASHGFQYSAPVVSQSIQYAAPASQEFQYSAPSASSGTQYSHNNQNLENKDEYAHPKYEFAYGVEDHHSGDIHSHKESRDGDVTKGEYSLYEPDGSIRTIKYTVDKHSGFNAIVEKSGQSGYSQPQRQHY